MNRTSDLIDDRIADWLEDDPSTAPSQLLDTVLAAVPSVPQRRVRGPFAGSGWPGRFAFVPTAAVLVVATLIIIAVAVIGTAPPAPSPTPTAIPLVRFDSPLYGYSLSYPDDWKVTAATERIKGANLPSIGTAVVDEYDGPVLGPFGNATILVAISTVAPGTTLADWTRQTAGTICGTPEHEDAITVAGLPATLSAFSLCKGYFHLWVTFIRGTQAFHVIWLNFGGTEPADRDLLDRILATFVLPTSIATGSPGPTAVPSPATTGAPIPAALIGAWSHAAPGWWWFLRAGDRECVQAVRTQGDCVFWQRGTTPAEIGAASIVHGNLQVAWKSGFCTRITSTYSIALQGDALNLVDIGGGCEGGNFALARAGTGSAPTAPPPPTP